MPQLVKPKDEGTSRSERVAPFVMESVDAQVKVETMEIVKPQAELVADVIVETAKKRETVKEEKPRKISPWAWVPTLYLAEGLPYALVNLLSVVLYQNLGASNTDIAFYTAWFYLPWVIKPLWSPFVDVIKTKRFWILLMQSLIAVCTAGLAFTLNAPGWFKYTIAIFFLIAFMSATNDISIDGFYMLALDEQKQSFFIGIRSTFYKISQWLGCGALLIVVGYLQRSLPKVYAWMTALLGLAGLFLLLVLWHRLILPKVEQERKDLSFGKVARGLSDVFATFFRKSGLLVSLAFILLYRLGEAMLVKMKGPFMLDSLEVGGLGLSVEQFGVIDGTIGMICIIAGGIVGGIALAKRGLKFWIWIMLLCVALPNALYILLAYLQPDSLIVIGLCVGAEQFGYGFGFTSFTMYLMHFSKGEYATSHFSLCTGFMALGMMLPGMAAGYLQTMLGYLAFFVLVFGLSLVVAGVIPFLKLPSGK